MPASPATIPHSAPQIGVQAGVNGALRSNPAPAPYDWSASERPSGNGLRHCYLLDAHGRKIAAVWGKHGEREATADLLMAAPRMLAVLREITSTTTGFVDNETFDRAREVIAAATGAA